MSTREQLTTAFQSIVTEGEAGVKALNWAVNYARRGLYFLETYPPEHEVIHDQVLYTLSNIDHWRGAKAKEARAILKAHVGLK